MHLRFATGELDAAVNHLAACGIDSILTFDHDDKWVNVYVDSHKNGGVRIELIRSDAELAEIMTAAEYSWRKK